jgi:hypothetical protein
MHLWSGALKPRLAPPFRAGGVGIVTPVADELLSGFRNVVGDSGYELENIIMTGGISPRAGSVSDPGA